MICFVDTSGFMALVDPLDPYHTEAVATFRLLRAADRPRLTTNYVAVETVALLHKRSGIAAVRIFVDDLLPIAETYWVTPEIHSSAIDKVINGSRRGPSLVDCVSFEVMRMHGINEALAFDRHFTEAGYLLPS